MLFITWAAWLILATRTTPYVAAASSRNYESYDYFSLHLDPVADPEVVARSIGAQLEGPIGQLSDHYTFSISKDSSTLIESRIQSLRKKRRKRGIEDAAGVLWHERQRVRPPLQKRIPPPPPPPTLPITTRKTLPFHGASKPDPDAVKALDEIATTLDINDPIFKEQWHLYNTIQPGHDLNVTGVWLQGITGNGSITSIVDDGLDMYSEDLKDNYFAEGSWDYNDPGPEPKPRLFDDRHGTRCAGEVAAAKNSVCGVGMAYDGQVSGIRILSKLISDEDEAAAINYGYQDNQIYSCSWGPPDDGETMDAPSVLIQRAMVNGVQNGRGGLGSVFVFAAGNGAAADDNCNFDGYTNSIYSITVGAIDEEGNHPYYSEPCSAQLIVTYSSGATDAIHTTDVGAHRCYAAHGGTSAAGPLVAGSVALALGFRNDLSWRDMQYLCIEAAIPVHLDDGDWQDTATGKKFSHVYGYGKIDTWRLLEAAKTFESVKAQAWYQSPWLSVQHAVPQGDRGLASSFTVTQDMLTEANLARLEHITVTMNVNHTRRGDLSVELRSPTGLVSYLSTPRRRDTARTGYEDWTFMSVVHWGEQGVGRWTVVVKDTHVNDDTGRFIDWRLSLWGECIDESKQELHPLPDDHDDDHDTVPGAVATTSVQITGTHTGLPTNPSDHIHRPINEKPRPSSSEGDSATSTATATATATPALSDDLLPPFFPSFGVSKRTQIWIYGSIGLIVVFCAGLAGYFFVQRRKRIRHGPHNDYEFEILDDEEETRNLTGGRPGKKVGRKAGELYDAFAGGSEEDLVSSDEEDESYRDESGGGEGSSGGETEASTSGGSSASPNPP